MIRKCLDFTTVLIDAECTHDGSIAHIDKYISKNWEGFEDEFLDRKRLESLEQLQRSLLLQGFSMCKVGGLLVYSTCSFSKKQNEFIVRWFLQQYPQSVELIEIPNVVEEYPLPVAPFNASEWQQDELYLKKTIRFSPKHSGTSGLYIALFRKLSSEM
jgi:16S rRNA C967 or C1407 C5-methylase (RsmB/RsmF family)